MSPVAPTHLLRTVDRVAVASAVVVQVLVDGAAVVSLGLWLATRSRRPGRAVTAAVLLYGLVTLVWPTLVEAFTPIPRRPSAWRLALCSPVAGPILTLMPMFNPFYGTTRALLPYAAAWLVATAAAWLLRGQTARTLDRRIGRMP